MLMRGKLTLAGLALLAATLLATALPGDEEAPAPATGADVAAGPADRPATASAPAPLAPPASIPPPALEAAALEPPVARGALDALPLRAGRPVGDVDGVELEYTLRPELTRAIWKVIDRGRVALGHVIVMDPTSGELLAYVSTDPGAFPPTRQYPAASLVKVVTAAAALDVAPGIAREKCHFSGNKYRLNRRRLDPPGGGPSESLRRALASSNNQCFAQWAIHRVGAEGLLDAIARFGLLDPAAPRHAAGAAEDPGDDALALGRLGSGLDGLQITPLHAAQIAAVLADGNRVQPYWVERAVTSDGRELSLPGSDPAARVLTPKLANTLREMLVDTTVRGTARKAFRTRRGRPLLSDIPVSGKTGSLNGEDPKGRYEWFAGLAPADEPRVAIATVAVQGPLYWMSASQMAAEVLKAVFCPKGVCDREAVERYVGVPRDEIAATPRAGASGS